MSFNAPELSDPAEISWTGPSAHCRSCGQKIPAQAAICMKCGVPQAQATVSAALGESPKSKTVAGVLGILFGGLGVHRFYMGYIGIGLLQLFLTIITFGIAGLWGFIEGIVILCGGMNHDSQGRPLRQS